MTLPEANSRRVCDGTKELSARESETEPRTGTIPESYVEVDDIHCFDYAQEEKKEFETLDGTETLSIPDKYSVVFIDGRYVAFERCKKDIEDTLLADLSKKFAENYSLSPIEFEEDTLRNVIYDANSILQLDVSPTKQEKPDKLSARDTKLEETDFPEAHRAEPFEKVKVELPDRNIDVAVSFDKNGTVILHTRSMEMYKQARVLRLISQDIIDEYLDQDSFQRTLF